MWLWFVLFSLFEYESSHWFSSTIPFDPFITLEPSPCLGLFQKSRSEECRGRPVIDRKRKFLDTDLAHDSEGSEAFFPLVCGFFKWSPVRATCRLTLPVLPSTGVLILVSSVFNSRVVSGSQSTSRGLVSWRQVSWLSDFPYKTFRCAL